MVSLWQGTVIGFLLPLLSRKWILWLVKLGATDSNNFSRFEVPLSFFFLHLLPFIATRWISSLEDCSFSLLLIPTRKQKVLYASLYHYHLKVPAQTLLLCLLLILSMSSFNDAMGLGKSLHLNFLKFSTLK